MSTPYTGGAKDICRTYNRARYTAVSASSAPQKGDVAIWGTGEYCQISVVLVDAGSSVQTLTQRPDPTRIGNLSKAGLLGCIRPIV